MKELILAKYGEIALKGLNRNTFEDILMKNIRRRLRSVGAFQYSRAQSTIYITPKEEDIDLEEAMDRLKTIFGIAALSRACICEKDFADISKIAPEYLEDTLSCARTFKVEAKRSDKAFPMKSPELCAELGGVLLDAFPHLKVDVKHPDVVVMVEIRDTNAYVHGASIKGAGGLPVGSSGKALLLLSGGIDSPVAGYRMAWRTHCSHSLCEPAVHIRTSTTESGNALPEADALLWQHRLFLRSLYQIAGSHQEELPGRILYHYHAPFDDGNCSADCQTGWLSGIDYGRKRRPGCQPDHAGTCLHRCCGNHSSFPSADRNG